MRIRFEVTYEERMNSMKRPVIGMIPAYDPIHRQCFLRPQYAKAIQAAGGLAFILPLTEEDTIIDEITDLYDGFLFTGGADLSPELYGEEPLPCTRNCVVDREKMEFALIQSVLKKNKPLLGICRGMQFLNIYFHGTLYQDVLEQKAASHLHMQEKPFERLTHSVDLVEGSPLGRLLKKSTVQVNSMHHQAVKTLGPGLEVMAHSDDGLIEAIRHPGYSFVWGIQWHPEFLIDQQEHLKIFETFIQQARQTKTQPAD